MTDSPTARRPRWLIGALVPVVASALLACGAKPTQPTASAPPATLPVQVVETFAPVTYHEPTKADFLLTVKTTRKKCFGSAGCNVTYHIDLDYLGDELDPSKTYQITYEVSGVEDGPAINTLEITGDEYTYDENESGQTPSSSTKLKAKVTDIEEA